MVGVLVQYLVKQVLHFDHADFMKAMKEDVQPLLGEVGLWALTNYCNRQKEKGKLEKKKKYYFMNKFSPKKLPL